MSNLFWADLFWAELSRLGHRRLARALGVAVLLGLVALVIYTGVHSNRDLAQARALAVSARHQAASQAVSACASAKAEGQGVLYGCADPLAHVPPVSGFYVDPRFSMANSIGPWVEFICLALGMLGFLLGASAVGAEWGPRTFAGLLAWEPRRLRVVAAKVGAVTLVVVAGTALAVALAVGGAALVADTRGTLAHVGGHLLAGVAFRALRGLGLVAALTAAGAALGGIVRSTAGALGLAGAYILADVVIVPRLAPGWVPWTLSHDALALVQGHATSTVSTFSGIARQVTNSVGAPRGGIELALVAVALVSTWSITLWRRDVT